jgi:hypothetical protein
VYFQASVDPLHKRLVGRLEEREYSLLEGLEMVRTEPTRGLILPTEIAAGKEAGGEGIQPPGGAGDGED